MKANSILGALFRVNDFFMNRLIQSHSGTAPETSRNAYGTNQGRNGEDSQSDLHPEANLLLSQTTRKSGLEDRHDIFKVNFET